ncbi:MAG: hypothetical protein Q9M89_04725 [Persephonella sp.]|nr:hypothetical protein [Persephonella sp.]
MFKITLSKIFICLMIIFPLSYKAYSKELDIVVSEGEILQIYDNKVKIKFTKGLCRGTKIFAIRSYELKGLSETKKIRFVTNGDCSNILKVLTEEKNEKE